MNKKKYIWDYIFILLIVSVSGWITSYDSFEYNKLYWDNAKFFSIFRDNLHSLNFHGEIAWWFPHKNTGWAAYYYSILGDFNCTGPIFVTIGFFCWLTGKMGIHITEYFPLYVFYISYLIPLALTASAYTLSRQIFSSRIVHFYIIIVSAFSPGVILNLSDVGLVELAVYSMFFFAAYINFLKRTNIRSYYLLLISSMIICLTINFPFTLWNAIAIPLFVIFVSFVNYKYLKKVIRQLKTISWHHYVIGILLIIIALIPCFSTFLQGGDLVRSSIGEQVYALENIRSGNPFEFLTVSIPGFGYEWRFVNNKLFFMFLPSLGYHLSINYLGILALPLTILGLAYGSRLIRIPLLLMLIASSVIIVLGATSPILSLLLSFESPLRANNHFSDIFFRSGGFLLIVFSSALGLNVLIKHNMKVRIFFISVFLASALLGMFIHFRYNNMQCFNSLESGLFTVFFIMFSLLLLSYFRDVQKKTILYVILALVFLDLSTFTNIHVKKFKSNKENQFLKISEKTNPNNIGLLNIVPGSYSGSIIINKNLKAMQNENFQPTQKLPRFWLFNNIHVNHNLKEEISQYNHKVNIRSLPLSENDVSKPEFSCFLQSCPKSKSSRRISCDVHILRQSYNQLELKIKSSQKRVFFIRDEYSPYWSAWVNGKKVDIARAFFNSKAVIVPKGESIVLLKFKPPYIGFFLFISYITIIIVVIFLVIIKKTKRGGVF